VTSPVDTLIDLATRLGDAELERALNHADKLDLVDPEQLRVQLTGVRTPGAKRLRELLDKATFVLTDSELERMFIPIAASAGLPEPETQVVLHGHRVDFFFRDAGLVVETDGLRYHRTPTQQSRDRVRDQQLTAAGLRVLRFTHAQIKFGAEYVARILRRLSCVA
jgi:very-short-patch-repair endonuclease